MAACLVHETFSQRSFVTGEGKPCCRGGQTRSGVEASAAMRRSCRRSLSISRISRTALAIQVVLLGVHWSDYLGPLLAEAKYDPTPLDEDETIEEADLPDISEFDVGDEGGRLPSDQTREDEEDVDLDDISLEEAKAEFDRVDEDSDGFLSLAELTKVLEEVGLDPVEDPPERLFRMADANKDGGLTFKEALTIMASGESDERGSDDEEDDEERADFEEESDEDEEERPDGDEDEEVDDEDVDGEDGLDEDEEFMQEGDDEDEEGDDEDEEEDVEGDEGDEEDEEDEKGGDPHDQPFEDDEDEDEEGEEGEDGEAQQGGLSSDDRRRSRRRSRRRGREDDGDGDGDQAQDVEFSDDKDVDSSHKRAEEL